MDLLVPERHRAAAQAHVRRPVDRRAGVEQPVDRVRADLLLMLTDGVHPEHVEVVDRRPEPDLLREVHRAGLELVGDHVPGRAVVEDLVDHVPAAEEHVHRLEMLELAVQPARGGRAEHLVPADREEVAVELGDVHRHVRNQLRPVHEHQGADRVRCLHELLQRRQRAEGVRHPGDREELGPLGQERAQLRKVEQPVVGQRHVPQDRPRVPRGQLPRNDVGVVLHVREEDLVAFPHEPARPRVRHEVGRLGRAPREDDRLGLRRADEPRELGPRRLVEVGGLFGQQVQPAMRVCVVIPIEVGLSVDDLARLLRRGGRVEVDDRGAVRHRPLQDREVRPDPTDIQTVRATFLRHRHRAFASSRVTSPPRPRRGRAPCGYPRNPWPRAPARAPCRPTARYARRS